MKPASIRTNFTWMFFGTVYYSTTMWAILSLFAKFGNAVIVGQFSLGMAICAPIVLFMSMQNRLVQATDAKNDYRFGHYMALGLFSNALAALVIVGTALVIPFQTQTRQIILLVGLAKLVESIGNVLYGLMQKNEKMKLVAKSMLIKGTSSIVLCGGTFILTNNIILSLLGLILAWILTVVLYDARMAINILSGNSARKSIVEHCREIVGELKPIWSRSHLKSLTRIAFPLAIVGVIDSLNINVPRYFIQYHLGESGVGYFSAIAYAMVVGSTVINAIGHTVMPRLAGYFNTNIKAYLKLLTKTVLLGTGLALAGIVVAVMFGEEFLRLLYTVEYSGFHNELIWMMVAAGIWYIAGAVGFAIHASRQFIIQTVIYVLMILTTSIASLVLIAEHGILGATWAICFGMTVRLLGGIGGILYILQRRQYINLNVQ
ncbi:lipopolysaccharide biosynthesis protein [Candidatus Zixiibacteriota bacterium]